MVLLEVSTKQELLKLTTKIARVLKQGGTLIATVCSKDFYNADWSSVDIFPIKLQILRI